MYTMTVKTYFTTKSFSHVIKTAIAYCFHLLWASGFSYLQKRPQEEADTCLPLDSLTDWDNKSQRAHHDAHSPSLRGAQPNAMTCVSSSTYEHYTNRNVSQVLYTENPLPPQVAMSFHGLPTSQAPTTACSADNENQRQVSRFRETAGPASAKAEPNVLQSGDFLPYIWACRIWMERCVNKHIWRLFVKSQKTLNIDKVYWEQHGTCFYFVTY